MGVITRPIKIQEMGRLNCLYGLCSWLSGKESTCQCSRHKRRGWIPGLERSHGVGNGNSLQYSFLENFMDRGGWWASLWGHKDSDTTEQLITQMFIYSVQFRHSAVFDSLRSHEPQHAKPPCPSPTPGVHSDSHPLSQ